MRSTCPRNFPPLFIPFLLTFPPSKNLPSAVSGTYHRLSEKTSAFSSNFIPGELRASLGFTLSALHSYFLFSFHYAAQIFLLASSSLFGRRASPYFLLSSSETIGFKFPVGRCGFFSQATLSFLFLPGLSPSPLLENSNRPSGFLHPPQLSFPLIGTIPGIPQFPACARMFPLYLPLARQNSETPPRSCRRKQAERGECVALPIFLPCSLWF